MAEPSKQTPNRGRTAPQKQRKPQKKKQRQDHIPTVKTTRKTLSKKRREEMQQRVLIRVVSVALIISVLLIVAGVFYDRLWVPAKPVAQVGEETLTRNEFRQHMQDTFAQQIIQNLQMVAMFGDQEQLREQFALRSPIISEGFRAITRYPFEDIRQGIDQVREQYGFDTAQLTDEVIRNWQDRQLLYDGAAEMGIQVSGPEVVQEVNQNLVDEMGFAFLPASQQPDATGMITPTRVLTPTLPATLPQTTTTTPAALAPTATPPPTQTPTERPTLEPTVASERVQAIFSEAYKLYLDELNQVSELQQVSLSPQFTAGEFRAAMEQSYRYQYVSTKVREQLVPEETFVPDTEPERVTARHILLSVDVPPDASEAERERAFKERKVEALSLVGKLREGADFAELARERSEDPGSREAGGNVGSFDREGNVGEGRTLVPEFVEAAFALEEDEISDPVRTQFGWHIIQVTDQTIPSEETQLSQARQEALDEWLEDLREGVVVRRFPMNTPTPTIPPLDLTETGIAPTMPITTTTPAIRGTQVITGGETTEPGG